MEIDKIDFNKFTYQDLLDMRRCRLRGWKLDEYLELKDNIVKRRLRWLNRLRKYQREKVKKWNPKKEKLKLL